MGGRGESIQLLITREVGLKEGEPATLSQFSDAIAAAGFSSVTQARAAILKAYHGQDMPLDVKRAVNALPGTVRGELLDQALDKRYKKQYVAKEKDLPRVEGDVAIIGFEQRTKKEVRYYGGKTKKLKSEVWQPDEKTGKLKKKKVTKEVNIGGRREVVLVPVKSKGDEGVDYSGVSDKEYAQQARRALARSAEEEEAAFKKSLRKQYGTTSLDKATELKKARDAAMRAKPKKKSRLPKHPVATLSGSQTITPITVRRLYDAAGNLIGSEQLTEIVVGGQAKLMEVGAAKKLLGTAKKPKKKKRKRNK